MASGVTPNDRAWFQLGEPSTAAYDTWWPALVIPCAMTNKLRSKPPQPMDEVTILNFNDISFLCLVEW